MSHQLLMTGGETYCSKGFLVRAQPFRSQLLESVVQDKVYAPHHQRGIALQLLQQVCEQAGPGLWVVYSGHLGKDNCHLNRNLQPSSQVVKSVFGCQQFVEVPPAVLTRLC